MSIYKKTLVSGCMLGLCALVMSMMTSDGIREIGESEAASLIGGNDQAAACIKWFKVRCGALDDDPLPETGSCPNKSCWVKNACDAHVISEKKGNSTGSCHCNGAGRKCGKRFKILVCAKEKDPGTPN